MKLSDRFRNITVAELITGAVCVVASVVIIGSAVSVMSGSGAYEEEMTQKEATLAQLRDELGISLTGEEETETESETETETIQDIRTRYSAQAAGTQVASYQTSYIPYLARGRETDNAVTLLYDALVSYMDADDLEGAECWCVPDRRYQSGNASSFTWSFECPYEYAGETLPVIWFCRYSAGDDQLAAYATGVYDSEAGTFSNIRVHLTETGELALGTGNTDASAPDIEDMEEEAVSGNDVSESMADETSESELIFEEEETGTTETAAEETQETASEEESSEPESAEPSGDTGIPDNFFASADRR